jgi:hypothetical protein
MSENGNYSIEDFDDPEFLNSPDVVAQLRKALKAQQKANREKEEALEAANTELATLRGTVTQTTLEKLLEAKGAKPGLAKFMNGVEATDESVTTWLTENGDFFGYKPGDAGAEKQEQAPSGSTGLSPEMEQILAAMKTVQNHEANAAPGLVVGDEKNLDFINRVGQNAHSFDDVEKAFRQAGLFSIPAGESHE